MYLFVLLLLKKLSIPCKELLFQPEPPLKRVTSISDRFGKISARCPFLPNTLALSKIFVRTCDLQYMDMFSKVGSMVYVWCDLKAQE
jgi:hypothetical protein